jgi:hypothetical protein
MFLAQRGETRADVRLPLIELNADEQAEILQILEAE